MRVASSSVPTPLVVDEYRATKAAQPAVGQEDITRPAIILDTNIEAVLAPQESLGKSVLESVSGMITLLEERRSPFATDGKLKDQILRVRRTTRGDEVDVLALLNRIKNRVEGCGVVAAYDVKDLAKSSMLILKFLAELDRYVDLHP